MKESVLLRHLLDCLPDAVSFKDAKGRYRRINRVLASWYGLKHPDDAIGKTDADFYPQEFARATQEAETRIRKTRIPILDQEERIVGRDGKSRWVSTTKVALRDGRAVVGILAVSRDIRGVKRAEEQIRDSEALYQSLIESLPQCIFRKDAEGRYVYVNQRLCDVFGLTPKEFLGKTDFDVNPRPMALKYRRDDDWVRANQKMFEAVEEVRGKNGKIKIRIHKTPIYDSQGRVVGVQGVFSPLSDR
jgi:PAS domain S-box-containing protein